MRHDYLFSPITGIAHLTLPVSHINAVMLTYSVYAAERRCTIAAVQVFESVIDLVALPAYPFTDDIPAEVPRTWFVVKFIALASGTFRCNFQH